jgi:anti-sigma-K factor RskA
VLADITTVRPLPPAVEPPVVVTGAHAPGGRSRFRPRLLVAAAAALIALGGAVTIAQPWEDESSQTQLTAAERVAAAEDAETFTKTLDNGAEATLVRSRSLNEAVLVTNDMPDAPDGSVYELWLVHDDQMVPAGLMSGGDHEIVLEGDPATANGFGITVEPDGGSDQPTSEPVTQIAFENA